MNFRACIKEEKDDSTINVAELLNETTREEDDQQLLWSLQTERLEESLHTFQVDNNNIAGVLDKLQGYKPVHELHELQKGRHIRWIRRQNEKVHVTNGGILMDIKFLDSGTHILCMNLQKRFIQYKWDDCITFQKLTLEELCIRHHLITNAVF